MKNQEKTKPSKKRIIMYYIILAACVLAIAGATVGIVFAVKNRGGDLSIDKDPSIDQPENPDGNNDNQGNTPNEGDNPQTPENPDDNKPDKPVSGNYEFILPVKDASISQAQVFAYDQTLIRYCVHQGVDFAAAAGTDVLAVTAGTVKEVSINSKLYGAVITIEHADGVTSVYKYIDPAENLKAGDKVSGGDVIGKVAVATGNEHESGDHLHYEVYKNNQLVNPEDYFNITNK